MRDQSHLSNCTMQVDGSKSKCKQCTITVHSDLMAYYHIENTSINQIFKEK